MSAVKKDEESRTLTQKSEDFLIIKLRQQAIIKIYFLMVILILNI
jgi:hypothetical protein